MCLIITEVLSLSAASVEDYSGADVIAVTSVQRSTVHQETCTISLPVL